MRHWATTVHRILYLVCTIAHRCDIDMLRHKEGFRFRLHAEKVFVRGWEMVPKVHRFQEVGLAHLHCSPRLRWLHFLKPPLMNLLKSFFTHRQIV